MRLKTKITLTCISVATLMIASLGLVSISSHKIDFYQKNIRYQSLQLRNVLKLKNFLSNALIERLEFKQEQNKLLSYNLSQASDTIKTLDSLVDDYETFLDTHAHTFALLAEALSHKQIQQETARIRILSTESKNAIRLLSNTEIFGDHKRIKDAMYNEDFNTMFSGLVHDKEGALNFSYDEVSAFHEKISFVSFVLTIISLFALLYLALALARTTLKKLEQLMDLIGHFSHGNYHSNYQSSGDDELDKLGQALNTMALELIKNQATLNATAKMSALGEMASGIAHEINNPLGIISARAGQIKRIVQRETVDIDTVVKFSESIDQTVQRIAKIIQGLRAFSRNSDRDSFLSISMRAIILDTLALCIERFKNQSIDVIVDEIDPNIEIECRSAQIIQILVNLLNNAHDAIVNFENKWVHVRYEDCGDFIRLSVVDSGTGIPLEIQERLFQPFFTTKEVGKGTGLGLSIANRIVMDHNGRMFIDRNCANTCFVIELPKVQPEAGTENTATPKVA